LHHRKEGWPSDQENIAKHPLIAAPRKRVSAQPQERTGGFPIETTRKTTPSAPAKDASQHFLDGRIHPSLRLCKEGTPA
jgi:hypothetical protein